MPVADFPGQARKGFAPVEQRSCPTLECGHGEAFRGLAEDTWTPVEGARTGTPAGDDRVAPGQRAALAGGPLHGVRRTPRRERGAGRPLGLRLRREPAP